MANNLSLQKVYSNNCVAIHALTDVSICTGLGSRIGLVYSSDAHIIINKVLIRPLNEYVFYGDKILDFCIHSCNDVNFVNIKPDWELLRRCMQSNKSPATTESAKQHISVLIYNIIYNNLSVDTCNSTIGKLVLQLRNTIINCTGVDWPSMMAPPNKVFAKSQPILYKIIEKIKIKATKIISEHEKLYECERNHILYEKLNGPSKVFFTDKLQRSSDETLRVISLCNSLSNTNILSSNLHKFHIFVLDYLYDRIIRQYEIIRSYANRLISHSLKNRQITIDEFCKQRPRTQALFADK